MVLTTSSSRVLLGKQSLKEWVCSLYVKASLDFRHFSQRLVPIKRETEKPSSSQIVEGKESIQLNFITFAQRLLLADIYSCCEKCRNADKRKLLNRSRTVLKSQKVHLNVSKDTSKSRLWVTAVPENTLVRFFSSDPKVQNGELNFAVQLRSSLIKEYLIETKETIKNKIHTTIRAQQSGLSTGHSNLGGCSKAIPV